VPAPPPRHSVKFSPVISTWMPPDACQARGAPRKKPCTSATIAVEVAGLVAVERLGGVPCIGVATADHKDAPWRLTLSMIGRQQSRTLLIAQAC